MKQSLMADVNPVEISNGDDGIDKRLLNIFETIKDFHFTRMRDCSKQSTI
jgi:hypothetical protein